MAIVNIVELNEHIVSMSASMVDINTYTYTTKFMQTICPIHPPTSN